MADDARITSSRPTFKVAGREIAALADALLELSIRESVQGLYACEAVFGNWGPSGGQTSYLYFDRQTLEFGKDFEVLLGSDTLFKGRIMGLEGRFPEGNPPAIAVLVEDRFQDLRMTRRTRTFADTSDSDLMNKLASDHGLTPNVSVTGPTHKVLAQANVSDLAFMRERARVLDVELWIDGTTLSAKTRSSRNGGTLTFGLGNELREFEVLADLAEQRTSVIVTGWDLSSKAAVSEKSDDSTVSGEVKSGDSGANLLKSAIGERKETVGFSAPVNSQEARTTSESLFKQRARKFITGRGVAKTDAKLRVGATLTLKGLGPLFSGDYYVVESEHRFDAAKGLRTSFAVERPGLGKPA
jgi:phage protein D